jgi:hypothetical protein
MSSTRRTETPARYISIKASSTKLRDLQPYLAGFGLQITLIVAGARIAAHLAARVTLRIA